jgi:hypothetical protein
MPNRARCSKPTPSASPTVQPDIHQRKNIPPQTVDLGPSLSRVLKALGKTNETPHQKATPVEVFAIFAGELEKELLEQRKIN